MLGFCVDLQLLMLMNIGPWPIIIGSGSMDNLEVTSFYLIFLVKIYMIDG